MQGRGAGHDHEEPDHAGQQGPDDHIDPLVAEVLDVQLLVDRVGLDEGEAPGGEGGADRGHRDEQRLPGQRQVGHDQPLRGGAPVGMGEEPGDDVGDEDRAQREQEVLDAAEALAQDESRDADRRERHAEVATHAAEQVHAGGDPGELGAEGAGVGDHESGQDDRGGPLAVALADQCQQALAGDYAEPDAELVKDDQRRGRERQDPEQLVAVLGAEDRVGGDAGGVVVGEAGEQARPDHGEQCRRGSAAEQQRAASGEPPMGVATGGAVGSVR